MAKSDRRSRLHTVAITDQVERASRRFARIWVVGAVAAFVLLAATVGLPHGPDLELWEKLAQLVTLAVLVIGTSIAWRSEGWGGAIILIGAVFLGVFAALQHQPAIAFLPVAAFVIPAVAFLVAWNRTKTFASLVVLGTSVVMVLLAGGMVANAFYQHGYGPAHPQSDLPPLPDSPVEWLWSGAVTTSSAVVVTRIDAAAVSLHLDDGISPRPVAGTQVEDVWRFELDGLIADTEHRFEFEVDGVLHPERSGSFDTFPVGPADFTIAVGSCSRLGSNGVVYETILGANPDLLLVPGDFFYADHVATASHYTEAFSTTLTQPAQAALFAEVPIAYVWDDHDYAGNNTDRTAAVRTTALSAFTKYVPHYPTVGDGTIGQAFMVGRVKVIMLDTRSARDPRAKPDDNAKTMIGSSQMEWLGITLRSDPAALNIIVSSVPWIAATESGADHWGGYTSERAAIAEILAEHNVLMVAGDAHMVAIDDGTNTKYSAAGNAAFPLLHAAALDRPGSAKGGPYSEGAFPGGGQFGLVEVQDDGDDEINVRLSGVDWENNDLVEYDYTVVLP